MLPEKLVPTERKSNAVGHFIHALLGTVGLYRKGKEPIQMEVDTWHPPDSFHLTGSQPKSGSGPSMETDKAQPLNK